MKKIFSMLFLLLAAFCLPLSSAYAGDKPTKPKLAKSPEAVAKGKVIYFKRCSFCHGLKGDGDGPVAHQLFPRPRDFTKGLYKFRTTNSGELPTDENLFRTVSNGLPGSAMQAFDIDQVKSGLSEEERWQVIYYIETFYPDFQNPDFDPSKQIAKVPAVVASSADSIAKGKKLFLENKCWECHGKSGKGNGPNSPRLKDKFRADPTNPANLTRPWRFRAGSTAQDILNRFNTGINGMPMPSFVDSVTEADRWHLANYVVSLQMKPLNTDSVLRSKLVKGELSLNPEDPSWSKVEGIDVRMTGQVIWRPRWENPSIDAVTVKSIYNDKEIAFKFTWDDRTKDIVHQQALEYQVPKDYVGYASWEDVPRKAGNFRDSVAIQFPIKSYEGTKKPHFLRGDGANPVNLWVWKSDLEELKQPSAENDIATGPDSGLKAQDAASQTILGKGVYLKGKPLDDEEVDLGTWSVVMKRPLTTKNKNDVQFTQGKFIPFSLDAWDGANGEQGLMMAVSTWNNVILEAPVPNSVYIYTILGIVLVGCLEVVIVRKLKK